MCGSQNRNQLHNAILWNHKMVEAGRDFGDHQVQPPLLMQIHPEEIAQDVSRWVLSISREGDCNCSGGCSVICHSCSKEVFLHIKMELPVL